jgi:hypothetical protein
VYVSAVKLVSQWQALLDRLPPGWSEAQVRLRVDAPAQADRFATLLGPLQISRPVEGMFAFRVSTDASGPSAAQVARLLDLLDREGAEGTIELASSSAAVTSAATASPSTAKPPAYRLPAAWAAGLAALPADWSDLFAEVELGSSDYLERAALFMSPINPRRDGTRLALWFRCARKAGYGASPAMVRRCFERCDEHGIVGSVHVLRALSDTRLEQTQGPVWQLGGRTI